MRLRSLRAQIALLSVCVSAVVLGIFGLVTWTIVHRVSLKRVDREIMDHIIPQLGTPQDRHHWARYDGALHLVYGADDVPSYILLVKGRGGEILLQSVHWPAEIKPEQFPDPDPDDPSLRMPPPGMGPPPGPAEPRKAGHGPADDSGRIAPPMPVGPASLTTVPAEGQNWRVCAMSNGEVTVVLGVSLQRFEAEMARVRGAFLLGLPVALLAVAVGSWLLAQRGLRPVESFADTAESVTASTLDQRLPTAGTEVELLRLATVLNDMLDRLEASFSQATRFSADAAHELKTPLTIMQGELEMALREAPPDSEQQRVFGDLLEETQRLAAIVRKLLLLARADSGLLQPTLEQTSLTEIAEGIVEDTEALGAHLAVIADLEPRAYVMGDDDLLRQGLWNLASNAIKYNEPGGFVEFRLRTDKTVAQLSVSNAGPGIPEEDRGRVFDRFHRADPSRGRRVDGAGLGLSVAREIIRAHGGELTLEAEGGGDDRTTFTVTLPAVGGEV